MRKYELMVVFPLEEDQFKPGIEAVRKTLADFGAQVVSEDPYGDRDLTYEIKKRTRGRYVLFTINASPEKIVEMDRQFKLNMNLLTFLFVRVDE
ncbi:MAG TPA: 30S ribosomal protein S6 [Treponemataceae bacterium]|jgi:small subunit ribosomal protein S6|nr:30S ribosomal protein S6 [Treponemataceae bacterium]HPX47090.1 30S ribosomal protein S6 [Treponemataceae bacterium]HQL33726.1 30S ribosomal protein S6 [Treponemataceae bacterium]